MEPALAHRAATANWKICGHPRQRRALAVAWIGVSQTFKGEQEIMRRIVLCCAVVLGASLLNGCAGIKIAGKEWTPRYDREGNELAHIRMLNSSHVKSVSADKDTVTTGAVMGESARMSLTPDALVGGLIGAAVSAIRDAGKLKVWISDFDDRIEDTPTVRVAFMQHEGTPWPGWEKLQKGTWARVKRNSDGSFELTACETACEPVPDTSGNILRLTKAKWGPPISGEGRAEAQ
jgi:hypothetical protein